MCCLVLAYLIIINEADCNEEIKNSKIKDAFRGEFSFSSLKKDLKYKYYMAMNKKLEDENVSTASNLMQMEEKLRIQTMKNILNIVKYSITH
jgi:hypothetical protein